MGGSGALGRRGHRGVALVLLALIGPLLLTLGVAVPTAGASPVDSISVPQGLDPALDPAAVSTGATAPSTPLTVAFILKARNLHQLERKVGAGWRGAYLTTTQFSAEYGQTPQLVNQLESYLRTFGISSSAYPDGLDVTASGTAAQFDKALTIALGNYSVPGRRGGRTQEIYASRRNPRLPRSVAPRILSVLGLTNYSAAASQSVEATGRVPTAAAGKGPGAIPAGQLTPQDFENHYNLAPVVSGGGLGQGQTIGIITLASINQSAPTTFWKLLGLDVLPNRITLDNVDGGSGPPSFNAESYETDLDVEQSGAIAPQSKIIVYQAPPTDYGFVDAFFAAASDDLAGSVSASWGESETNELVGVEQGTESPTLAQAFDEAALEMGTQGQSAFASSGDQGPFEANSPFDEETTNLTTLIPAGSPYITAAGGTTLAGTQSYDVLDQNGTPTGALQSVTIPKERTWSWDYQWPLFATFTGGTSEAHVATSFGLDDGSGGGYSVLEPEPSYQRGVRGITRDSAIHYLTPTAVTDDLGIPLPTAFAFDPSPTISTGAAPAGRVTPDLAFDADPETGYAVYDPQFGPVYGSDIQMFGGTSIVAPQLNGTTAVLASALGHRLGFWNPVIYAAAQSDHTPFTPLSDDQIYGSSYFSQTNADGSTSAIAGSFSNNNLYYTGTPGTIYNPASGLGFADLADLGPFFTH